MITIPIIDLGLLEAARDMYLNRAMHYWNLSLDKDFAYKFRDEFEAYSWYNLFVWAGYRE